MLQFIYFSLKFCSFLYNGVCFDGLKLSVDDVLFKMSVLLEHNRLYCKQYSQGIVDILRYKKSVLLDIDQVRD